MTDNQFIQLCEDNKIDIQKALLRGYNKLSLKQKLEYKLDKFETNYEIWENPDNTIHPSKSEYCSPYIENNRFIKYEKVYL